MNKWKKWLLLTVVIILIFFIVATIYVTIQRSSIRVPSVIFAPLTSEQSHTDCQLPLVTVLAIDGGGVKGIIPAVLLRKMEEGTQQPVAKLFDFMSGVSTGSILVALLTTPNEKGLPKYSAAEAIALYRDRAKEIFSATLWHRIFTLGGLIGPKYQSEGMQRLTREYLGDTTMNKLLSHVVLFGYDLKNKGLLPFSNRIGQAKNMPYFKVRDVIDGTTAIMSYFESKSLYSLQDKMKHTVADASLVLNNPVAMGFLYAEKRCPNAQHYIVVSLGTGVIPKVDIQPQKWGLIRWLPDMLVTTIEGETVTADLFMDKFATMMNFNDGNHFPRVLYMRFNPDVPWKDSNPIDGSTKHLLTLEAIAEHYYQNNKLQFDCLFNILKNHSLDNLSNQCIDLLKKKPIYSSAIFNDLQN